MSTLQAQPGTRINVGAESPRKRSDARQLLLRPAIIYLIVLTQLPLVFVLTYSLSNWNLLRPDRTRFVGLQNYGDFVTNPDMLTILRNTLVFSTSVVIFSLVFGMLLALLLNRQFIGRGIARTLLITPFLIMPTVSAVMWKNMLFNPSFGLISTFCPGRTNAAIPPSGVSAASRAVRTACGW